MVATVVEVHPVTGGLSVRMPYSVCNSCSVLGQDTSPSLPADGGQRARWHRLFGSLTSVSLPQNSCGYHAPYHCQWMTDCSVQCFGVPGGLDKDVYKCRPFTLSLLLYGFEW
ncbi:hypothetical protein CHARACLAT_002702 [Characodon lateralis]|uniref:Uncharacterized protein n=1 Tax=Characodon lateralis TaxID=208331 RepID=A0ABU7DRG1_9TELE|nr:hypothetical protein [Characodon lateralis]